MADLELSFASGEKSLSVRHFSVEEEVSGLFEVSVVALSENDSLDLEALLGKPASLRVASGMKEARTGGARLWTGICAAIEQVQGESTGLSTYKLRIVPDVWLLTQRRGHRIFQHVSIPTIVEKVLGEWKIKPVWHLDKGRYPKLEYKVQYGETDHAFVSRLLEEAGIVFTFPDDDSAGSHITFTDRLHQGDLRPGGSIPYVDNPSQSAEKEFVTHLLLSHEVRPGALTIRDYDFRNPGFALFGNAPKSAQPEDFYEQYHYQPGAALAELGKPGNTPAADDQAVARYDHPYLGDKAKRALSGVRNARRSISFDTNTSDLWPGVVFTIEGHPQAELDTSHKLVVTSFSMSGSPGGEWTMSATAVFASDPYLPPLRTPKPKVQGVQSATVVGPAGQEIHTDEFGRVRVQFPWDREGKKNERSSCWIRVSQGWAGTGYGMITIPRIGQEVLVGFLNGDPDQPIITGRVFNAVEHVPYDLPEHKTRSTWKSDTSMGSNGSNEIMFEDLADKELIYMQAQRNMRKLVKRDETITVRRNRQKLVLLNETETTGANRTEVTGANRTEITGVNRTTVVGAHRAKLVGGNETERTEGNLTVYVGGNQDVVIKQVRKRRVEGDSHLTVKGDRRQRVEGSQSLTVNGDQQEKVGQNHALAVDKEIHFKAGTNLVIEAARDITLRGPGGFIRIDAGGITIRGNLVKINSGGSPGAGQGSAPVAPDEANEAEILPPPPPKPEDVLFTGIVGSEG